MDKQKLPTCLLLAHSSRKGQSLDLEHLLKPSPKQKHEV